MHPTPPARFGGAFPAARGGPLASQARLPVIALRAPILPRPVPVSTHTGVSIAALQEIPARTHPDGKA
jgi:hypothetical protein